MEDSMAEGREKSETRVRLGRVGVINKKHNNPHTMLCTECQASSSCYHALWGPAGSSPAEGGGQAPRRGDTREWGLQSP